MDHLNNFDSNSILAKQSSALEKLKQADIKDSALKERILDLVIEGDNANRIYDFQSDGGVGSKMLNDSFPYVLKQLSTEDRDAVEKALCTHAMTELGVGTPYSALAMASTFMNNYRVPAYTGIDKYAFSDKWLVSDDFMHWFKGFVKSVNLQDQEENIHLLQHDMLGYLAGLPEKSTNVVIANIDDFVWPSAPFKAAVQEQLARVIPSEGILLNLGSALHSQKLSQLGFKVVGKNGGEFFPTIFVRE